jgi:hypothetical protein
MAFFIGVNATTKKKEVREVSAVDINQDGTYSLWIRGRPGHGDQCFPHVVWGKASNADKAARAWLAQRKAAKSKGWR